MRTLDTMTNTRIRELTLLKSLKFSAIVSLIPVLSRKSYFSHIHGEAGKSHLDLGYPKGNFTPKKYCYDARGKGRDPYIETKIENYVNGIEDYYVRAAYEELVDKCKSFYKESRINLLKDFLFRSCRLRYRLRGVRNGQPPAAFPSRCIRVSESSVQPCRSPQ